MKFIVLSIFVLLLLSGCKKNNDNYILFDIGLKNFKLETVNINYLKENIGNENFKWLGTKTNEYFIPKDHAIKGLLYYGKSGIKIIINKYRKILHNLDSKSIQLRNDIEIAMRTYLIQSKDILKLGNANWPIEKLINGFPVWRMAYYDWIRDLAIRQKNRELEQEMNEIFKAYLNIHDK
mgnify:CR=1 FL=1